MEQNDNFVCGSVLRCRHALPCLWLCLSFWSPQPPFPLRVPPRSHCCDRTPLFIQTPGGTWESIPTCWTTEGGTAHIICNTRAINHICFSLRFCVCLTHARPHHSQPSCGFASSSISITTTKTESFLILAWWIGALVHSRGLLECVRA